MSQVAALAATVQADAVLLDVVEPQALATLIDGLGSFVLLRPLLDYVRTSRGERQPVFVGFGRLIAGGHVEQLAEEELRPPG